MEHALLGFLDRLKIIALAAGIMTLLAGTAWLIAKTALMGQFRQMDMGTRRAELFMDFMLAIMPVCFITILPTLLGFKKQAQFWMFAAVVVLDIILWVCLHHRFKLLSPENQQEWKAIIPRLKWARADRILIGIAAVPLILIMCGVQGRWMAFDLPVLFVLQIIWQVWKFYPRRGKTPDASD